MYLNKLEFLID